MWRHFTLNQAGLFFLLLYATVSSISIGVSSVAIACSALCALRPVYKERTLRTLPAGFGRFFAFFILTFAISAIFAHDPGAAFARIGTNLWRMTPLALAIVFLRESKHIAWFVAAMALSITIADFVAIWQGLHGELRAPGFGANAMILAGYLVQMIPFLLVLSCDHSSLGRRLRMACMSAAAVSGIALIFNGTRGAWVAVAGMLLLYGIIAFKQQPKRVILLLMVLSVGFALLIINPGTQQRLHSIVDDTNRSNLERIYLWKSAWQMYRDHPLTGVGVGNFEELYQTQYILPEARYRHLGHAHNNFLHVLAETGIVGLTGFIGFFGYIACSLLRHYRKRKDNMALAGALVTVTLLLQGLTEYNYGNSAVMRMYWAIIGAVYAAGCLSRLSAGKNDKQTAGQDAVGIYPEKA